MIHPRPPRRNPSARSEYTAITRMVRIMEEAMVVRIARFQKRRKVGRRSRREKTEDAVFSIVRTG